MNVVKEFLFGQDENFNYGTAKYGCFRTYQSIVSVYGVDLEHRSCSHGIMPSCV